jgi:broad specificity phosphatase PhoE
MPVPDPPGGKKLILIKHAMPAILPEVPPSQWQLSEQGQQSCSWLAEKLAAWQPTQIISSIELKAQQTAHNVAATLGLPVSTWPDLHEHERQRSDYTSQADFQASIKRFFAAPEELVFGCETARQAQQRFSTTVQKLLETYPDQTLAVVAHGTVITLFVAQTNLFEPFGFWNKLTLPSMVVLSLPGYLLQDGPLQFH